MDYEKGNKSAEKLEICKMLWDKNKVENFKNILTAERGHLGEIIDKIIRSELDIDRGVSTFADTLYNTALSVFSTTKVVRHINSKQVRKYKSPWFTVECEIASRQLKSANKVFKRNRSDNTRTLVINKRREYCKVKRIARAVFKANKKRELHELSSTQPQKFWSKIRGKSNNELNLTSNELYDHFKNLFASNDIFENHDVEEFLSDESGNRHIVDQLDQDFSIVEVEKAIS